MSRNLKIYRARTSFGIGGDVFLNGTGIISPFDQLAAEVVLQIGDSLRKLLVNVCDGIDWVHRFVFVIRIEDHATANADILNIKKFNV